MKFWLPKLAFRNLTRYRKRTLITAGAIAYGLIMFIVTRSILIGIDSDSENNLRLYETADGRKGAMGSPHFLYGQFNFLQRAFPRGRQHTRPFCCH